MKLPEPTANQTTLCKAVKTTGIGLHTGQTVKVRLQPAGPDEGIVFVRVDLAGAPRIPARPEAVNREALTRRTELTDGGGAAVGTVEHLMAACLGMGLDNVVVEVNGPEVPIFDGSAAPWVELIAEAGVRPLETPRRWWRLTRPVALVREHADIVAVPAERMTLVYLADLRRGGMPNQTVAIELEPRAFAREVAPARTFVYYEDVEALRAAGLIRGGSLECAVVIRDGNALNGRWRLESEPARHKLLDLIGDLAMLGRPIAALISARSAGHALHHAFIDLLRKDLVE